MIRRSIGRRHIVHALTAVSILATSAVLAGCGSEPATVTSFRDVARQPIAQDLTSLRKVAASSRANDTVAGLYRLLAAAQSVPDDREGWKGLALLRARAPEIVRRLQAEYPSTRRRVTRVRVRTPGGAAVKAWLLEGYESEDRRILQLEAQVAGGGYSWGAVLSWVDEEHAAIAHANARLDAIIRGLPARERHAARSALR